LFSAFLPVVKKKKKRAKSGRGKGGREEGRNGNPEQKWRSKVEGVGGEEEEEEEEEEGSKE
jgi:hypothetical protein